MSKTIWLAAITAALALLSVLPGAAALRANDLIPYLQSEINEVAILQGQATSLQQQGDPLGAAVVASYIPDHQMQSDLLTTEIRARGGDPSRAVLNKPQELGTRLQIINADARTHGRAVDAYQRLARNARQANDQAILAIAINGENGASRHLSSLQIARASTPGSPSSSMNQALLAALSLERGAVIDLQTQATRLQQLGDPTTANTLLAMIPQHQAQVANLEATLVQLRIDSRSAMVPPTVALATRDQIIEHNRIFNTQMTNTYALPIAALPPSPLRQIALQGQGIAIAALGAFCAMPA